MADGHPNSAAAAPSVAKPNPHAATVDGLLVVTPAALSPTPVFNPAQPAHIAVDHVSGLPKDWQKMAGIYRMVLQPSRLRPVEAWFNVDATHQQKAIFKVIMKGVFAARDQFPNPKHPNYNKAKVLVNVHGQGLISGKMLPAAVTWLCRYPREMDRFRGLCGAVKAAWTTSYEDSFGQMDSRGGGPTLTDSDISSLSATSEPERSGGVHQTKLAKYMDPGRLRRKAERTLRRFEVQQDTSAGAHRTSRYVPTPEDGSDMFTHPACADQGRWQPGTTKNESMDRTILDPRKVRCPVRSMKQPESGPFGPVVGYTLQEDTLKKHAHDTRPRPSAGLGRYKRLETRLSYQTTYGETFAAKAVDPAAPAAPPSPEPAAAAAAVAPVAAVPAPTVAWPKESDAAAAGEEGDPAVRHVPPKRRTLREHVGERHAKDKAHRHTKPSAADEASPKPAAAAGAASGNQLVNPASHALIRTLADDLRPSSKPPWGTHQGVGKAMETEYHAGIGRTGEIYQQIRSEPIEDWLVKTYPTAPVWEALIAAEEAG